MIHRRIHRIPHHLGCGVRSVFERAVGRGRRSRTMNAGVTREKTGLSKPCNLAPKPVATISVLGVVGVFCAASPDIIDCEE